MVDIFDIPTLPEIPFLEELADALEGTFCVIAYAGYENNFEFIKERQRHFKKKYGGMLSYVLADVGIFHIIPAYNELQDLLYGDPSPAEIREMCEDCLNAHLVVGQPSEEYWCVFQEYYERT